MKKRPGVGSKVHTTVYQLFNYTWEKMTDCRFYNKDGQSGFINIYFKCFIEKFYFLSWSKIWVMWRLLGSVRSQKNNARPI